MPGSSVYFKYINLEIRQRSVKLTDSLLIELLILAKVILKRENWIKIIIFLSFFNCYTNIMVNIYDFISFHLNNKTLIIYIIFKYL